MSLRAGALLLALAVSAAGEDVVHLENGNRLRGAVVSEDGDTVVVDLGTGRVAIPRDEVRLVERAAEPSPPRRTVTHRDEWFLVLHRGRTVGWRRFLHILSHNRVHVEERTVFFRPGGGEDVAVRRVETADAAGRPLEFLYEERWAGSSELVSGEVHEGRLYVRRLRDGERVTRVLDGLPEGWVFPLPAWSAFLAQAEAGATRTLDALDPRRLEIVELVLRRGPDRAAPRGRPCRALSFEEGGRATRALYREGEGSVLIELNGSTLIARRSTRERVELARRAHREPEPMTVREALHYPFPPEPPQQITEAPLPLAGLCARLPKGWESHAQEGERGRVAAFERVALFASIDLFAYDLPDADADLALCLERAAARLRLTQPTVELGEAESRVVGGFPARVLSLSAAHRGESLRGLFVVIRAPDRYLVVLAACPVRWFDAAEPEFRAILDGLQVF